MKQYILDSIGGHLVVSTAPVVLTTTPIYIDINKVKVTSHVLNCLAKLKNIHSIRLTGDEEYLRMDVKNVVEMCHKINMSRNRTTRTRLRSDTTLCQVFGGKDSLDRFGDDLCEVLLSFLSLEDRFRCECVSKQWQRVVYETQTDLIISGCDIDPIPANISHKRFELILKKCANITRIECTAYGYVLTDSMVNSIVKHCRHLNAFLMDCCTSVDRKTIDTLFAKFAKQLKTIRVIDYTESETIWKSFVRHVKFCANLHELDDYRSRKNIPNVVYMRILTNKITANVLNSVSKLKNIRYVELDGNSTYRQKAVQNLANKCPKYRLSTIITSRLNPIGVNCKKLKRLALIVDMDSGGDYCLLLQTINENFNQLKRLEVKNISDGTFQLTSESLNLCNRLTHLTLGSWYYTCSFVDNKFFENIDQNIPNVVYMHIITTEITENVLNSMSKLNNIRSVELRGDRTYSQKAVHNLPTNANKCPKISRLCVNGGLVL
ncbi:unnamed protein product [Oppiella nova]|uniref:F-box domain-containing protein n=1 Tax=Oppiella nova TaxID=334625 RepID=A0A7R9QS06_9ACAR|nr:unnamed protein product [Oppiella nova]CAG2173256.1 unnamed protein product [Oppiella nova]